MFCLSMCRALPLLQTEELPLLLADKTGQARLGVVTFHCINTSVILRLSEFVFVKGRN